MVSKTLLIVGAVVVAGAVGAGGMYYAMSGGYNPMDHHGGGMMQHDEANMPGLQGENATPEESKELAVMFRNFDTITREVENLPNGIRTVTKSTDPEVMNTLVSHAAVMINRVQEMDDPKIRIQSPTLDIFFKKGDEIETVLDVTEEGLIVIQTSENPELVAALQKHAAEVTDMTDRGMAAVHEMMMKQGRGH